MEIPENCLSHVKLAEDQLTKLQKKFTEENNELLLEIRNLKKQLETEKKKAFQIANLEKLSEQDIANLLNGKKIMDEIHKLEPENRKLKEQIEVLERQLEDLRKSQSGNNSERLREENARLREENAGLTAEMEKLRDENAKLTAEKEALRKKF